MKRRFRKKHISHFVENCDIWFNPQTGKKIVIPKSGKVWNLFLRACNKGEYKNIAVAVLEAYAEYFSEIQDDKESEDYKNFVENGNNILKIYKN